MELSLPFPPSGNRYWRHYRGHVVKSAEARRYQADVKWRGREMTPLVGPVALQIQIYRPRRRRDLDNCLKILLDGLQGVVYEDDAQVVELHVWMEDDPDNPRVDVWASAPS